MVPPEFIGDQIAAALASNTVRAIKIGMLGTAPVEAVAANLPRDGDPCRRWIQVLATSSGGRLLDDEVA